MRTAQHPLRCACPARPVRCALLPRPPGPWTRNLVTAPACPAVSASAPPPPPPPSGTSYTRLPPSVWGWARGCPHQGDCLMQPYIGRQLPASRRLRWGGARACTRLGGSRACPNEGRGGGGCACMRDWKKSSMPSPVSPATTTTRIKLLSPANQNE